MAKVGDTLSPMKAKLRLPPAEGNKTEQAFGLRLFSAKQRGEIFDYAFEPVKLRLGRGAWYTPDFMVYEKDRTVTVYEVKGFWREAARVRIKVAARLYPMLRFVAVVKDKGVGWKFEEIGGKPSVVGVLDNGDETGSSGGD